MNCPDCGDSRMGVNRTIQWEGNIWRARKCPDCSAIFPSVERLMGGWPEGIHAGTHKISRQRERRNGGRGDVFNPNAGADLAGVMNLFARPVASAQQLAPD